MHYNEYRCAQINGRAATGYSSAQATKALEEVFAQTMPREMGFDYLGMSFQEQKAAQGVSPVLIFGFSVVCVFLILAAQYESWSLPFSVLMGTPVAVFGAFLALFLRGFENNVYVQIGLIMLIGLAAKNAILIVAFAKNEVEHGKSARGRGLDRGAHPAAADFDDVVRVHPRLRAAVAGRGLGRRIAADAGHGGHRRNVERDVARHFHRAGHFLCGGKIDRPSQRARGRRACGRTGGKSGRTARRGRP